jgi:hypothetical protein
VDLVRFLGDTAQIDGLAAGPQPGPALHDRYLEAVQVQAIGECVPATLAPETRTRLCELPLRSVV